MEITVAQIYLDNYLRLVGAVILYYDHLLTFRDEHAHIWAHPRTGAALLFLLNRYFAFFSNIVITVAPFVRFRSVESCQHYSTYRLCALIGSQVIVGIIQALRTFALYRRDTRVGALMAAVAVVLAAVAIWCAVGPTPDVSLAIGCTIASPRHTAIRYAVAWEALFLWDSFIFALTLLKTYKERFRYAAVARGNDLLSLIVRDGAVYFAIMACAQCANSLTYYFCPPALIGTLCTFASAISVSMMSRLMLNLHRSAPGGRVSLSGATDAGAGEYMMSTGFGFAGATEDASGESSAATSGGGAGIETGILLCDTATRSSSGGKGKARAVDG